MMQERELCSPEIINRSPKKTSGHNRRFYVLLPMLNYNLYDIFKKTSSAIINNYIYLTSANQSAIIPNAV